MEKETEQGIFIVIEGADGSGKSTQFKLLKERLKAVGYEVASFDFPRYDQTSSHFVKKYLNGEYGPADKISPYAASLFYALDRYEASKEIKSALKNGKIVLANRYTGSNMAHQGSKFDDEVERRSYFVWADNLEFQLLDIPRPNLSFYLRVPAKISYDLISKKGSRTYTKNTHDEHEKDIDHLRKTVATYDLLCRLFPKDYRAIECTKNGKIMSITDINNLLWEQLKPLLPAKKSHASRSVVVTLGKNEPDPKTNSNNANYSLTHEFKDASLYLKLTLQRLSPRGIDHSFNGWTEGNYRYYTPGRLPKQLSGQYKHSFEQFSILNQQLSHKMARFVQNRQLRLPYSIHQLLQPVTPLGALTTFKLTIEKSEIQRVASVLLAADSEELQWAAKQLYVAARHQWPNEFRQPLESQDGPAALSSIISNIASNHISAGFSADETIKLIESKPRLEFDLLAESLYQYANLSADEIASDVMDWPYSQKYQSLKALVAQPEILRNVTYKLDVISDYLTLDKIVEVANLKKIQTQIPTPRYGYDMPKIIDEAAADDLYDELFDESLKLYSLLQENDREDIGTYATLAGHKLRWQLQANAEDFKLILSNKTLASRPVIKVILEKLTEAHPLLWDVITQGQAQAPAPERNGKARVKPAHRQRSQKKSK